MTITELTLNRFFTDFIENVLIKPEQYDANDLKGIFIDLINKPNENIILEGNTNILITKNFGSVKVNGIKFKEFFSYVHDIYPLYDQNKFLEICDRLIEDYTRRSQGEFYTPTPWANYAHRMIEKEFGDNWREKYVVWDPAWGTGNLTRDYKFKELYCSTLNESDLKIGEGFNQEAAKFQYDFLNDDVHDPDVEVFEAYKLKLVVPGLVKAFEENKPIIIFINPPYGTSANTLINLGSKGKKDISLTKINKLMTKYKLSTASSQLYIQFLYRIINIKRKYKLTNINICFFSKTSFLSTTSFNEFRNIFLENFEFKTGMIFNSANFSSVSSWWPVLFSIFSSGIEKRSEFNVFEIDNNLNFVSNKVLYFLKKSNTATHWVKELLINQHRENKKSYLFYGPLKYEEKEIRVVNNFLGSMHINYNSMRGNEQFTGLYSGLFAHGNSEITLDNFYRILSLFTIKRCSMLFQTWINDNDEYFYPHNIDESYFIDCIVYSLFNNNSFQSSIRSNRNIENQFFWLPNKVIQDLANNVNHPFPELYQDTKIFNKERFVYLELQKNASQLSSDALEVLKMASELVVKSFPERVRLYDLYPDWYLNAWDAGWYQTKLVLKETMKKELNEFRDLYKKFENRMKEGIYKFGFLK